MLLEVSGLSAGYGDALILSEVALQVPQNAITAIIGGNGAGKTTLMRTLSGLLPARQGSIRFGGAEISAASPSRRVAAGICLVPEGRLVFPDMSVQDTLRIGAYSPHARKGWQERRAGIYDLFPKLKERRHQRAGSLSGGEQQMLALGRGLMSVPRLLLLDEPSLGLSPRMAAMVFDTIQAIRDSGITICLVEQDVQSALAISDSAYVLEHGRIVKHGISATLLQDPQIREFIIGI